jgi:hypothetical protein
MENEQILKKVIEKATDNAGGVLIWKFPIPFKAFTKDDEFKSYYSIIFSHPFAKAFWGEKGLCNQCGTPYDGSFLDDCSKCKLEDIGDQRYSLPSWKYHIQEMVLEKEPLKYLEKFL